MYMGSDYPLKEPYLRWLTPIWHPNIDHLEPHHVCTNNVQNWFAAKPLAELVLAMGEMVQYKHYHAKWVSPFPFDRAAAEWVLEVAEPKGIVGPHKAFDERPLLRAQQMRNQGAGRCGERPRIEAHKAISWAGHKGQIPSGGDSNLEDNVTFSMSGGRALQPVAKAIRFGGQTEASAIRNG